VKGEVAMTLNQQNSKNPLQGITLEHIVTTLVDQLGWEELGRCIDIRCFTIDPSVKSSLKFLRRTPWARAKVENLYLDHIELEQ
jgi:uncharacterized protein (DUF2132 family)